MSGSALWADDHIVGVISAHHRSDGLARLAATRMDRIATASAERLAALLGLPGNKLLLPDVVPEPACELLSTAYRLQVADVAPEVLRGRDGELGMLAAFCSGSEPYAWWQGEAWAGKTALMAWFTLHPPAGVEVVSFFVAGGLAGQSDSEAFLEALTEQLRALAGRPFGSPATTAARRGQLLELIAATTLRCHAAGRRLLLVVDGLDEDTGPGLGKQSIASLLPRRPAAGLHVVVASRPDRELPVDVPPDHPLRRCVPSRISPSADARHVELFAKRELASQLGASALHADILGLIAASGGGLSRDDLAELTHESPHAIGTLLHGAFGHSVYGRRQRLAGSIGGAGTSRGYLFAHDTLRLTAEQEFGPRLARYRNRIHDWADSHRARGWPSDTPRYLLRDYSRMLAAIGDGDRLSALACDSVRHERMLNLTGGRRPRPRRDRARPIGRPGAGPTRPRDRRRPIAAPRRTDPPQRGRADRLTRGVGDAGTHRARGIARRQRRRRGPARRGSSWCSDRGSRGGQPH